MASTEEEGMGEARGLASSAGIRPRSSSLGTAEGKPLVGERLGNLPPFKFIQAQPHGWPARQQLVGLKT